MRLERAIQDKILELYLNEKNLSRPWRLRVARASLVYFDKAVNETHVSEAPIWPRRRSPVVAHPIRNRDRAIERRNYVSIRLLRKNDGSSRPTPTKGRQGPVNVTNRTIAAHIFAGGVFREESQERYFRKRYGERNSMRRLSLRTTLDPKPAGDGGKTMADGLVGALR